MMTQNSSCSRIVAVWLVLLAFLCCTMVPSLAVASKDIEIEMEGDPGDGMDYSGGGGGSGFPTGDDNQASNELEPRYETLSSLYFVSPGGVGSNWFENQFIIVFWGNGQLQFFLINCNIEWGAIR